MKGSRTDADDRRWIARWQERLLPFLIAAISLMAVFFFVTSLLQLTRLNEAVTFRAKDHIEASLAAYERGPGSTAGALDLEYLRWKTMVLLEREALAHRYAQVNATLMLRAWTRHLGFLTGMILALVGAIFILAKLSEGQTMLSAEGGGWKGALATGSPGIVLAVLGTVLMVVTLTASFEFSTRDVPVYLHPAGTARATLPPPPQLDSDEARRAEEEDLFPSMEERSDASDKQAPP